MAKMPPHTLTNTQIRKVVLQYFYDRNLNATSARGKIGAAVKIRDVKAGLKAAHGLSQQEVVSNLTYLISQGWIEERQFEKSFTTSRGTAIPSVTVFYQITAAGIDKIEGPGEFTMDKFHGIKIEATGQNIITLGDGNRIDARFSELGTALAELRDAIVKSDAPEHAKWGLVADVDTIQSQLAKPEPSNRIVKEAWEYVQRAATIDGCTNLVAKVSSFMGALLG